MLKQRIIFTLTARLFNNLYGKDYRKPTYMFAKILYSMLKNNGTLFTVKYIKQAKLHITRYMCGKPLYTNDCFVSLVGGFPKNLLFLKEYIDSGDLVGVKFVLTLLGINRAIIPRKNEDIPVSLNTITDPFKYDKVYTIPNWFVRFFVQYYGLRQNLSQFDPNRDLYLSFKSGPCGPSTITSIVSLASYPQWMLEGYGRILGQKYFVYLSSIRDWIKRFTDLENFFGPAYANLGKIHIVKDPECKMRPIAILDYFSQVFLKPFHNALFSCLRKMPCDRTFTQDPKHQWDSNSHSYWSLDLTAATDRLPITLQTKLLSEIIRDREAASFWSYLLSSRDFEYPDGCLTLNYEVGQPMGSYSSWASMAMTHHLIVQWASFLSGGTIGFNQYILLGDDIVIKNNKVANKYKMIMSRLGVDISVAKTHVSKDTYEFAKRWIKGNVELTGLPMRGLTSHFENPFIVYQVLFDWVIKGNFINPMMSLLEVTCKSISNLRFTTSVPLTKADLLRDHAAEGPPRKLIKWVNRVYRKGDLMKRLDLFNIALRYSHGIMSDQEKRNFLLRFWDDHGEFPLPGSGANPVINDCLFQGSIVQGVATVSLAKIMSSRSMIKDFIKNFEKSYGHWTNMQYHPIWFAFANHIESISKSLNNYASERAFTAPLLDIIKEVVHVDTDAIFSFDRDHGELVGTLDKVIRKSSGFLSDWVKLHLIDINAQHLYLQRPTLLIDRKPISFGGTLGGPLVYHEEWAPLKVNRNVINDLLSTIDSIEESFGEDEEITPIWDI